MGGRAYLIIGLAVLVICSTVMPASAPAQSPTPPAQSATSATGASVRQTGAVPGAASSPQETTRLAAALSYIDFAGVKLGAPLNEVEKALKAKDARYTFRPTIEIVWPGNNPPPDAPKSVTTLRAELQVGAFTTEAIDLMPARHPNPPVLIGLARHVGYPNDSGPSLDDLVARLRKEYGNESAVDPTAINDNYARTFSAKWFFDESGQVLRGNLGAQLFNSGCAGYLVPANNQGLCSTLTVLQVRVSASGAGVVHDFILQVKSNPLDFSATETTRAFLRQVEADIAQK